MFFAYSFLQCNLSYIQHLICIMASSSRKREATSSGSAVSDAHFLADVIRTADIDCSNIEKRTKFIKGQLDNMSEDQLTRYPEDPPLTLAASDSLWQPSCRIYDSPVTSALSYLCLQWRSESLIYFFSRSDRFLVHPPHIPFPFADRLITSLLSPLLPILSASATSLYSGM